MRALLLLVLTSCSYDFEDYTPTTPSDASATDGVTKDTAVVDTTPADIGCGNGCIETARTCSAACTTTRMSCQTACGSPDCRKACADTERTCKLTCVANCTTCTTDAGCANAALCASTVG